MGKKQRNPVLPLPAPPDPTSTIKSECEKALTSLRRGNHTKSLRLMRDALSRHSDSALLHRAHGAVHAKLFNLIEDPSVKQRHVKAAVEAARRAVELSPASVEYAHFYASCLFDSAAAGDGDATGYELAVAECERGLGVECTVDPALELLHVTEESVLLTPEARINQVRGELTNLIQKCNIASISSWMKTLGGDDNKLRLIPVRNYENPTELRMIPGPSAAPPRRNNEIKKASKTPEERRKEIEVRVAAARLLQQQRADQSGSATSASISGEEDQATSSSSGLNRRRIGARKPGPGGSDRMDQVRAYWNSMTGEKRLGFVKSRVEDLKGYYMGVKDDGVALTEVLSEALSFGEVNGTWEFYICFKCGEKLCDSVSHLNHVISEHLVGVMDNKQRELIPAGVGSDVAKMLTSQSLKPVDVESLVKSLEEENSN